MRTDREILDQVKDETKDKIILSTFENKQIPDVDTAIASLKEKGYRVEDRNGRHYKYFLGIGEAEYMFTTQDFQKVALLSEGVDKLEDYIEYFIVYHGHNY